MQNSWLSSFREVNTGISSAGATLTSHGQSNDPPARISSPATGQSSQVRRTADDRGPAADRDPAAPPERGGEASPPHSGGAAGGASPAFPRTREVRLAPTSQNNSAEAGADEERLRNYLENVPDVFQEPFAVADADAHDEDHVGEDHEDHVLPPLFGAGGGPPAPNSGGNTAVANQAAQLLASPTERHPARLLFRFITALSLQSQSGEENQNVPQIVIGEPIEVAATDAGDSSPADSSVSGGSIQE